MTTIKRGLVVKVMESAGFTTAGALSTGRLTKKINRINRVVKTPKDLMDNTEESVISAFKVIMRCIEIGDRIIVQEDRENIPVVEHEPQAKRAYVSHFDQGRGKYDWNTILSGRIVQLVQGEDYDCKTSAFGVQVRTHAKKLGVGVRISISKSKIVVQAIR
jgi:hypothetical protein